MSLEEFFNRVTTVTVPSTTNENIRKLVNVANKRQHNEKNDIEIINMVTLNFNITISMLLVGIVGFTVIVVILLHIIKVTID